MQVYRIFNKINKKSYIGITKWDFKKRYSGGNWSLWTHSLHIKASVKKYGLENFSYEILWEGDCSNKELSEKEVLYIDQYNSLIPNGYNLTRGGGNIEPKLVKEYELVDFNGNVFFVVNLSEFCGKYKLNYSAMLNMVSGLSHSSQGFSLLGKELNKVKNPNLTYILENISTGELVELKRGCIRSWAIQSKLKPELIERVCYGSTKISQNWKLVETDLSSYPQKYTNVKLLDPQGKIIVIRNIYEFCKENSFNRSSFYKLIKGQSLEAYGYKLPIPDKEFKEKKELKLGKKVELITPEGIIIQVKNISAFCRKMDFNRNSIEPMLQGRTKQFKGYKLKK